MVLSTLAGDGAVVDGVYRTMVVTGQATGTPAVMEPLGRSALDVVDGTDLRTLAALDAEIGIYRELPVRNHPLVEIAADDIGIEPWGGALLQRHDTLASVLDGGDDFRQLPLGIGNLTGSLLLTIRVHERQADIRLGHDDGVKRLRP